jgi:hypothetical protein
VAKAEQKPDDVSHVWGAGHAAVPEQAPPEHESAVQAMPSEQEFASSTALEQTPSTHASVVHGFPSSHCATLVHDGARQVPLTRLQGSSGPHWLAPPPQTPAWHVSGERHPMPSSHAPPSLTGTATHTSSTHAPAVHAPLRATQFEAPVQSIVLGAPGVTGM